MSGLTDKSAGAYRRVYDKLVPAPGVVKFCVRNNDADRWKELLICYNSTKEIYKFTLPEGEWDVLADDTSSELWKKPEKIADEEMIAPVSVKICGKR